MTTQSPDTKTKTKNAASADAASAPAASPSKPQAALPAGYEERGGQVVGFWDYAKGPIHCIPREMNLSDSKLDATKTDCLVIVELVDAAELQAIGDKKQVVIGQPGEQAGIWFKPGMHAILDLCGEKTFVKHTGEKPIPGKPSPMKTFMVASKDRGTRIPVSSDRRVSSKRHDEDGSEIPF
jgi:hypothetical protein